MIARLQKKVAGNKKIVNDITEMAILAFDQRDEAQSKITGRHIFEFMTLVVHCSTKL